MLSTISSTLTTMPGTSIAEFQESVLWILIVGFIIAFILGFGMGANDVAIAFGTSVGSKVLSLRNAYILATIFETLGAIFVGYNVTDTMRQGVINIQVYINESNPKVFLAGQVAVLGGCSAWLIIATLLKLSVSTTHSIVGATLGFSIVVKWLDGIRWIKILEIVGSWFISPILSGIVSGLIYLIVDLVVLRQKNPITAGLRALPVFYFFCIAFNTFAITYAGSKVVHLSAVPFWLALVISLGLGLFVALIVHFIGKPLIRKWLDKPTPAPIENSSYSSKTASQSNLSCCSKEAIGISTIEILTSDSYRKDKCYEEEDEIKSNKIKIFITSLSGVHKKILPDKNRVEDEKTLKLFSVLQVFTACFAGFAHGANDVSNAVAPLTAIWLVCKKANIEAVNDETPIYLLLYGVLAICVGLTVLGHRVIRTVGQDMSEVHPASGFTIEFGAAVTVLVASKLGLPISTTHCLVGSVVVVGMIKSGRGVDWKLFRNVAFSWIVTLPISGLIAAGLMAILRIFVK